MNPFILDEEWFGKPDVFHANGTPTRRVAFPEGKTWRDRVDSRWPEITCGEGISVSERIGILDRKLRVVGEQTGSENGRLNQAALPHLRPAGEVRLGL